MRSTHVQSAITVRFPTIRRHLCPAASVATHSLAVLGNHSPRASDANSRILRRSIEGATTADMAFIAQQAALDFERKAAEDTSEEE